MNRTLADFLVGLTVALGLAGIGLLLLLFGEFSGSRRPTYPLTLELADATGLSRASLVTLNGVTVGTLEQIEAAEDPRSGVRVRLRIEENRRIPRDIQVAIEQGLVGEANLAMRADPLPPGQADPGYIAPEETLRVQAAGTLDRIAGLLDKRLASFTDAASGFTALADTLKVTGDRLNEALAPRTLEDVDTGRAPSNLVSTVARVDQAVSDARLWLGDDAARTSARDALARLDGLMTQVSEAVEQWTETAQTLSQRAQSLGERGESALTELSTSMRTLNDAALELQTILGRMNRGEGTAGQLLTNPDLYRSINDAAVRLERALTEAQLLLEKYRKEGIPLRF
ncbi:MAG: MlaD family protein [Planctomycetota bacterium]|nr:MlaD family protein [Planctomycetota bacterium]